jgi:cytochrome c biogenesis protein
LEYVKNFSNFWITGEKSPGFDVCPKRAILKSRDSKGLNAAVWDLFSSLRLTIFLLILLAATSVVGTIILQKGTPQQYLAEYGPNLARILDFFGLFDMYHSWWFLAILALLVLNLVFCSLERLPAAWRHIFRPRVDLSPKSIQAQPFARKFRVGRGSKAVGEEIQKTLGRFFGYPRRVETSERLLLYFEKGRYGRLGVYVSHLSIIVILIGGMAGSVFGFKGVVKIIEGQTVDHVSLRKNGRYVGYPLGYQLRCDDFEISYYDTPGPKKFVSEYTSNVTILENGREVRHEKVRVNHPLVHKGLKFYQSSYGQDAEILLTVSRRRGDASYEFRVREGERVQVPGGDVMFQLLGYSPEVHNFGEGVQIALFSKDKPPKRIWLFKRVPDFDERRGGRFVFTLQDILIKDFTVLQVTKDPGVWIVWVGCTLLVIGTIMAFFIPHRRLWVHISREGGKSGEVLLGGNTHRNRVSFEKEFGEIVQQFEQIGLKAI